MQSLIFLWICRSVAVPPAAEKEIHIRFRPVFQEQTLVLGQSYELKGQPVRIETLRFYVSQIALIRKGKTVWQEANSYHLVDLAEDTSLFFGLTLPSAIKYDSLHFTLGIDSLTHVSGAMGGDLDPSKGMYWAWQSGYINFKLEGSSPLSTARGHGFQYHLGGYMPPYASARSISLRVPKAEQWTIRVNVGDFLAHTDLAQAHTLMSPGARASALSDRAAAIFSCDEK